MESSNQSKRTPLRHTVCDAENISKLSTTSSRVKSEHTQLLQLEHRMNDVLRQLSNVKNQVEAMKLRALEKDERIKVLERRVDELEKREEWDA